MVVQYIPRNMHTVFALLCFVVVIHWLIFPYPSGLLHWHCGNLKIATVPAKQPWWIWINTSYEFIMNDCITTTKQSTTKPCAYFVGYTVNNARSRRGDTYRPSPFSSSIFHLLGIGRPTYGHLYYTADHHCKCKKQLMKQRCIHAIWKSSAMKSVFFHKVHFSNLCRILHIYIITMKYLDRLFLTFYDDVTKLPITFQNDMN